MKSCCLLGCRLPFSYAFHSRNHYISFASLCFMGFYLLLPTRITAIPCLCIRTHIYIYTCDSFNREIAKAAVMKFGICYLHCGTIAEAACSSKFHSRSVVKYYFERGAILLSKIRVGFVPAEEMRDCASLTWNRQCTMCASYLPRQRCYRISGTLQSAQV